MKLTVCKCGQTPKLARSQRFNINILRVECSCGRHSATIMYTKPEEKALCEQAAADGWALGNAISSS